MKHLNATASALLSLLTASLADPCSSDASSHRNVGPSDSCYKPVVVERIGPDCYSLAHYGESNGDAMRDPEVCFLLGCDGHWYPYSFRDDWTATDAQSANVDTFTGKWTHVAPRMQADQVSFAHLWLRNIAEQQAPALRAMRAAKRAA